MSETDDTDVLLLIPPNFFSIRSSGSEDSLLDSSRTVVHKPPSCTAQVLGKLVSQVNYIENRLDTLEISASDTVSSRGSRFGYKTLDYDRSFDSSSLQKKYSTFPRRRRKKNSVSSFKKHDLSFTSLESTSTYSRVPSLHLKSELRRKTYLDDTLSMDGELSSINSTPSKKNDKLFLHEIDEFLTKVETYESPESKFKAEEYGLSPENVIRAAGDYLQHKINSSDCVENIKLPSGRTVPSTVLDKYIYLARNSAGTSQPETPVNTMQQDSEAAENKPQTSKHEEAPKETRSPSIRKLNFIENRQEIQPTSTPKRADNAQTHSFKPSSNKIYERASKVLEQYKQNHSIQSTIDTTYMSPKKEEFKVPSRMYSVENKDRNKVMFNSKFMDTIDTELLSLSELWGDRRDGDKVDSVKLEEERMKREHCEALIQDLQKKLLEHQERLAVAIKVDRSKDAVITKLRDAWTRLTSGLDRTEERHKSSIEKMCKEVEHYKNVADEAHKRTQHFESELYKALDLAHDYQEKCKHLANCHGELQRNMDEALANRDHIIRNKEREIEMMRENHDMVMRLNRQSADCVKSVEDALDKEKQDHESTKAKLAEAQLKLQTVEEETGILRQERDILKEKVNEERARCNTNEKQLAERHNQNCELLKRCDTLDNEVKTLRRQLDIQKNELKSHYQKQLEDAVLGKLQEFQQQLEQAEQEMESENRVKQASLIDSYHKQIDRIEDQHKLEVKVLEEKQREEIKLYRLQLAQANEKIALLESKVSSYRERRGQIAEQLHAVMEAQWRQALNILTQAPQHNRSDVVSTPDVQDYAAKIPPLTLPSLGSRAVSSQRRRQSDMFNFEGISDNELQQYVKLLLTKPPSIQDDVQSTAKEPRKDVEEEPTSDRPDKQDKKGKRSLNASKPPWRA